MNFSIILPSRDRSDLLIRLVESVAEHTANLDQVEVLVGVDDDDQPTLNTLIALATKYPFVQWHRRERSSMLNRDYLNWMSQFSKGKFLIAGNDDMAFRTPRWDEITLGKLTAYLADKPDGIAYGFLSDGILFRNCAEYCCFPVISRKGMEAVGFLMPPLYPSWNADFVIWRIYAAVNRCCDISEVLLEHVSYHSGLRERDNVSYHIEAINRNCGVHPLSYDIAPHVEALNNVIR